MKVDEWFEKNRFNYKSYNNIKKLVKLKKEQKKKISVLIPVLNEGSTIGNICSIITDRLIKKNALIDELIVLDSGSTDNTEEEAKKNGATFYHSDQILKSHRFYKGKGENLWKGLFVSSGDIIVVIDGDIKNFNTRFVYGVLGPMLNHKKLLYVNSFFRRPFVKGQTVSDSGGGRVTELLVRPLFNKFFPRLRGFIQPLGGSYVVKRSVLEHLPLFTGYGGDVIIPIDIQRMYGLNKMAQVNLGKIIHDHQELSALSNKAYGILDLVLSRANMKGKLVMIDESRKYSIIQSKKANKSAEYSYKKKEYFEKERNPIITLKEYRKKFKKGEFEKK